MSHYLPFSVSDDELERSTRSSDSFEYADSIEGTFYDASPSKAPRKTSYHDQRPRQRRKLDDQGPRLACPFAKHDPLKHRQCFRYDKMDQISRLKQHLLRVHQLPIHCVRCSQTFSTESRRDSHLRSVPGCSIQPNQAHLGITETQKSQLAQRVSAKNSKEKNWYLIYEILFPGSPRPDTPFLDSTQFSEELFAVREYAAREAPTRIAQLASALKHDERFAPIPPEYKLRIEVFALAAVKDVLDAVVDKWLRGGVSEQTNPPTPVHTLDPPSPSLSCITMNQSPSNTRQSSSGDEGGAFDILPSLVEGTKSWSSPEEPSRLDWLSMVADLDARSWDDLLNSSLDGALQQPLK
ncbi:hypothetical protein DPSP01_013925 [Paraphaeosphaeria sporulosa]|uniref:C2H2-type domain-containing protein n=1 Tax=Paraphaeosphaeria sporulosa TaxID=1460663 RepID=A0A177CWP4_9PLEO|nr:uncharacterized protein CC84DRAFT_1201068 [Paraphaeosphaeria sporulosa]OAG11933.1 hypothetical protein CC84DRAFT_1201068 [Paraphaeosphaeria sporulosa]